MNKYIIETKNLTKKYGSQKSVADLNIHVQKGRIYGLLGRNGAGKTTTMKMLLGLTKPTSGEVKIWGKSLQGNEKKLLPRIGSLIESPGFYPNLTATENLRIFATLRGVPNNHAIQDGKELFRMTKFICETKNLSKKYKDFYALKNVNLTIPKGEIYGLVGENGAGKTTLIRLLTGLNFKSEGEIILFGHNDNLQYERSKIGCTIEMPALYKDMTASQNLEVQRIQRGIPNKSCIANTLELIGLSNAGKKRVANFSLGMKQRLALGVALLGEPEFLILDEPVNGLDPTGIIELRELLKKLVKERETTILISSHILSELHQLATCYGFLHKGELLKQISAEKLNEECKRHICLKTDNIQKTTLILWRQKNFEVNGMKWEDREP